MTMTVAARICTNLNTPQELDEALAALEVHLHQSPDILPVCFEVLQAAKKIHHTEAQVKAVLMLARTESWGNLRLEPWEFHHEISMALELALSKNLFSEASKLLERTGRYYYGQAEYRKSMQAMYRAVETATLAGRADVCADATLGLGQIYFALGDHRRAQQMFTKVLEQTAADAPFTRAATLINLAANHIAVGELDQGEQLLQESLRLSRKENFVGHIAENLLRLAEIRLVHNEPEAALAALEEALPLACGVNFIWAEMMICFSLGETHGRLGDIPRAEQYLKQAAQLAERADMTGQLRRIQQAQAKWAAAGGNTARAYEMLLQAVGTASVLEQRSIPARIRELDRFANFDETPNHLLLQLSNNRQIDEGNLAQASRELLRLAARILQINRASLWTLDHAGLRLDCLMTYLADGDRYYEGGTLLQHDHPVFFEWMGNPSPPLLAHDAVHHPYTLELIEHYLEPQRITSLLAAPIRMHGRVGGILFCEQIDSPRSWEPDDAIHATQLANIAARALMNQEREKFQRENLQLSRQLRQSLSEKEKIEQAASRILDAVGVQSGLVYLQQLALQLSEILAVDYVIVGRLSADETQIDTLVTCAGRKLLSRGSYAIEGTPAQEVLRNASCFYPSNVTELFPNDPMLRDMAIGSYFGTALHAGDGRPLGIMSLLNREARTLPAYARTLFNLFSGRVSAEIEREEYEQHLRRHNELLEQRVLDRTRELEVAKNSAEKATIAKTLFLANMSHEIRTPLNAVIGYAQLLRSDPQLPQELLNIVTPIEKSGNHLLKLISDILDLSKIEAGQMTLEEADFDLKELSDEMTAMFALRCRQKNIEWHCEAELEDACPVRGDAGKLRQILINLLGNAVKFTDAGHITLRIARTAQDRFRFDIIDSGAGMSEEEQRHLFLPFHQAGTGRQKDGTGLGLALSRQHISLMGASLNLHSAPGEGSRFHFELPLRPAADGRPGTTPDLSDVVGMENADVLHFLVADDAQESRDVLGTLLRRLGAQVTEADDGRQALDLCRTRHFDLVFMDIRMPVMDGIAAFKRLREELPSSRPKCVAVTASGLMHDKPFFLDQGFDDVIIKPFHFETVFACLDRLLKVDFIRNVSASAQAVSEQVVAAAIPAALKKDILDAASAGWITGIEAALARLQEEVPDAATLVAALRHRLDRFDMAGLCRDLGENHDA